VAADEGCFATISLRGTKWKSDSCRRRKWVGSGQPRQVALMALKLLIVAIDEGWWWW